MSHACFIHKCGQFDPYAAHGTVKLNHLYLLQALPQYLTLQLFQRHCVVLFKKVLKICL